MNDWSRRLIWFLIALAILGADQATKALVRAYIGPFDRIEVVDGFFMLNHVENRGAAFGIFANLPDGWRELLLSALGALALTLVVVYSLRLSPGEWIAQLGLHMIFAGAIGNLLDRFIFGSVTDFLLFEWADFSWPSFNLADSAIVLGVALLLIDTFRPRGKTERVGAAEPEQAEASEPGGSDAGEHSKMEDRADVS
jgi:signal peptidase II